MRAFRVRRALLLACTALIAVGWFTWLRPVALGGTASYVVVQGGSMEPTYQDGDLVIVRTADRYHEGDVIAFRAGGTFEDPTRIIHRIVGPAGDRTFRTQGDNRDVLDPWTPGPDDIIGRATLHLPHAGQLAGVLTRPETLAALGGAAVVVGGERRRRRRRTRNPRSQETHAMKHLRPTGEEVARPRPALGGPSRIARFTRPRWAFAGLVACGVLAAPVLGITWSALRAPDSTQRVLPVGHVEAGIGLDYRFTGGPSAVYPTGEVTATRTAAGAVVADGPLYSRLLDGLLIELGFTTTTGGETDLATSYTVHLAVETPGGWSTTLDSIEPTPFERTGRQVLAVDLQDVARRVDAVADLTGVGGDEYTIRVTPSLDVSGASDVGQVLEHLEAPMTFAVADNVITANALEVSERHELTRTATERATYAIGPLETGIQATRGLLAGLSLVLVAGIAWFASVLFGGVGLGEPDRIAARYRSQIIDVADASAPPGPVVMVSAIDELARIAKLEQTVILHEDLGDGSHRYRVFLGSVTYEYEAAPEHGGAASALAADVDEAGG
jgi:signal peptidase I